MKKGDKVSWNWGKSEAEGKIVKKHDEPVTKNYIKSLTLPSPKERVLRTGL